MSAVWDYCILDEEQLRLIESCKLEEERAGDDYNIVQSKNSTLVPSSSGATSATPFVPWNVADGGSESGIDDLQASLVTSESSCRTFLAELDNILHTLGEVASLYDDVTGRTNSLMMNCENLLEQQHTLQATVEALKTTLAPFTEIEGVAELLGIPFDAKGLSTNEGISRSTMSSSSFNVIDPRAPEFKDVLLRLAKALSFLRNRREFRDSERYTRWLEQLQNRATSLVARAMRELLDSAAKSCQEITKQHVLDNKAATATKGGGGGNKVGLAAGYGVSNSGIDINAPLESAPLYQKFRGLGFRMRELSALLKGQQQPVTTHTGSNAALNSSTASIMLRSDQDVIAEVKQTYVLLRTELLLPFIKSTCTTALAMYGHTNSNPIAVGATTSTNGDVTDASSTPLPSMTSLCAGIRHAYSTLLRITQLEQHLFDSLFRQSSPEDDPDNKGNEASAVAAASSAGSISKGSLSISTQNPEVQSIVESISNATGDLLRPLVIRESDVDELCRLINTLAEDVRSQMLALQLPNPLLKQLQRGLERTVSDAQERLVYCAETKLRLQVELFEPMPSHLAYPDILEKHAEAAESHRAREADKAKAAYLRQQRAKAASASSNATDVTDTITDVAAAVTVSTATGGDITDHQLFVVDVSKTWYPPLKNTLSLLSKLYGVVDMVVFEHFAGRSVELCVIALQVGADGVRRSRSVLNGDLFLVRHLLVLREQLIPFEIRLQSVQKVLDFAPSQQALTHFATNARALIRFDSANSILQLAREGLPGMHEKETDAKKDLDAVLKHACSGLKQSALKMLMGPADAFLAKVTAFAGDIPTMPSGGGTTAIASNVGSNVPLLSSDVRATLKNQAFVRAERVKEMLLGVQEAAVQTAPDLRDIMKLYVENSVARAILLRPVQQEIDTVHKKLECIIASCVDPGQPRRDLEQLLHSIVSSITSELAQ